MIKVLNSGTSGQQLDISMSDEVDYVSGDIFAIVQRCNWEFFVPHSLDKVE